MVPKEAIVNILRSRHYKFKKQTDRMEIWKETGSTRRVELRRRDLHDENVVRILLRQAGLSKDEIDSFIASTKN